MNLNLPTLQIQFENDIYFNVVTEVSIATRQNESCEGATYLMQIRMQLDEIVKVQSYVTEIVTKKK